MALDRDTIAAIATAPGKGGVGIVRLSGPRAKVIGEQLCGQSLHARHAQFAHFVQQGERIDYGIALYFAAPASFTGEDVVELQGHGGPVVMQQLLQACVQAGARLARPGEFSERAFLNGKLDLAQAEAIADLIDASSAQAARNALHSLQGDFSRAIDTLVEQLLHLRMYVEAAIDFPEEEIDFLADGKVVVDLRDVLQELDSILQRAKQGALLRDGIRVVIAGKPNAGKSSLLNALAQRDAAIVTEIAGTTRDVLREQVVVDGLPLHIMDTAGLRDSDDPVEQEGIRRAWREIEQADLVLLLVDSSDSTETDVAVLWRGLTAKPLPAVTTRVVQNKIDKSGLLPGCDAVSVRVSAHSGAGMDVLRKELQRLAGVAQQGSEGAFSARARHVDALLRAQRVLDHALVQFTATGAGELLAEDLRCAQDTLSEITGRISSDELLGRIFGSFCIGK